MMTTMTKTPSGFDAYGHPVPSSRRSVALQHLRDIVPDASLEYATLFIDTVSQFIARDDPYAALTYMCETTPGVPPGQVQPPRPDARAPFTLDVTGAYRMLAVLLTGGAR